MRQDVRPGTKRSGLAVLFVLVPFLVVVLAGGAFAVWWFYLRGNTTVGPGPQDPPPRVVAAPGKSPPPASPADTRGTNLVPGGDFEGGGPPPGLEGEGGISADPANPSNRVWRLVGEAESFVSLPLPAAAEKGGVLVEFRVLVPAGTEISTFDGQQMEGVRLRTRFTDRYDSSAVADRVLRPMDNWQRISLRFEETNSGPYRLGIEAIWFRGPIYLDDLRVWTASTETGAGSPDLEDWFAALPWMAEFRDNLPRGVTLSIQVEEGEGATGWQPVEVRQHHADNSGFDPNVSPLAGIFRVSRDRSRIEFFDVVEGEYGSLEGFLDHWDLGN